MAFERAVPEQEVEHPPRPQRHLGDVEHDPRQRVDAVAVVGAGATVHVHRHAGSPRTRPTSARTARGRAAARPGRRTGAAPTRPSAPRPRRVSISAIESVDVVDRAAARCPRDGRVPARRSRRATGCTRRSPAMRSSRVARRAAATGDERAAVREHHLGDDAVVLELLDPTVGVPLPRGAAGDVLLGLLVRRGTPRAPRARTGDRRLPTPCAPSRELDALAVLDSSNASRYCDSMIGPEVLRPADRVAVGRDHHEAVHESPLSLSSEP